MEAASSSERELAGDKAARIVEAMRASVAARGTAGSTFDQVARAAGVSRGLLHYYFGTKERLLIEVVRRDCDVRKHALGAALAQARSADDVIAVLVASLEDVVRNDPGFVTLLFELFTLSRRHEDVAAEFGELLSSLRAQVADVLRAKQAEGVLRLGAEPEAVVDVIFSLGDGMMLRMVAEGERDFGPTIAAGVRCVRALVHDVRLTAASAGKAKSRGRSATRREPLMATQLQEKFSVSNPDHAWGIVSDVSKLVPCVPGAKVVSAEGPTKAKAEIKVDMGSMAMTFNGPVEIVEKDDGSKRAVIRAQAKEAGGQSNADGTVTISIGGDGGTVDATANVSGKAASMGEGTVQAVLQALIKQFTGNLAKA